MKTILCYGDSNTWGAVPVDTWGVHRRFAPPERWTGVFGNRLGPGWCVIGEGLPARTTVLDDPVDGAHLSGLTYLKPCLLSHAPLDGVVLMLGTNDLKGRFGLEAEDVAFGIERLLKEIRNSDCVNGGLASAMIVSPPPIETVGVFATMFRDAPRKSREVAPRLEALARTYGTRFLNAADVISSSAIDGIHFDPDQHVMLGNAVADTWLA